MMTQVETFTRFAVGLSIVIGLVCTLLSGNQHFIVILLTGIQIKVFHELRQVSLTESRVHLQKVQEIYDWFLFTNFMCLALTFIFTSHLNATCLLISFLMYTTWFILWALTILNVNIDQLGQYLLHAFWIHVAILYTVIQPIVIHSNISNGGIFWFLFPCSLVVCNDTFAYICGRLFGKTKLLNLSPNKTLEGFMGASLITLLFGYEFSSFLVQFDSMTTLHIHHIQLHGVILALYASLAAPFGGYFASALKRAGKIKDFDNCLPGHGGITDRVDCQLLMGVFTFIYFNYIK